MCFQNDSLIGCLTCFLDGDPFAFQDAALRHVVSNYDGRYCHVGRLSTGAQQVVDCAALGQHCDDNRDVVLVDIYHCVQPSEVWPVMTGLRKQLCVSVTVA